MPKKFQGENSKAVTARARKAEAKAVEDARKKQEEEDSLWQETDKHVLKKGQRKVSCYSNRLPLGSLLREEERNTTEMLSYLKTAFNVGQESCFTFHT